MVQTKILHVYAEENMDDNISFQALASILLRNSHRRCFNINISLILDAHSSHMSLECKKQAMEMGVDILTLPSHTSPCFAITGCELFQAFQDFFQGRTRHKDGCSKVSRTRQAYIGSIGGQVNVRSANCIQHKEWIRSYRNLAI